MSHTRVKTTYSVQGAYGSTETKELYCWHSHTSDCVTFYDANGDVTRMFFDEWETGNDLYDAMERLMFPYKGEWGVELNDGVEHYSTPPWETEEFKKKNDILSAAESMKQKSTRDYLFKDKNPLVISKNPKEDIVVVLEQKTIGIQDTETIISFLRSVKRNEYNYYALTVDQCLKELLEKGDIDIPLLVQLSHLADNPNLKYETV